MTRLLDSIGLWFTDYYLLSATLLLLALIAIRLTRQPIHRLTIVKSTLVALALLAGLCALPGWSVVHLLTADAPPPTTTIATSDSVVPQYPTLPNNFQPIVAETHAAQPPTLPAAQPTQLKWNLSWRATLAAVQLAGATLVLLWLALGIIAAHRLRTNSTEASPELVSAFQHLAQPTTVELRTSPRITVPVALGILRPAILLPLPFREGPGEGSSATADSHSALPTPNFPLTPILAHELAHIRNHDLHWLAVSRALMILLWSQPLFWLARRRMRLDQESLADAAAAEVSSREQYAEQLVSWARNLGNRPTLRIASAVGLWEGPSQLRQRIAILLDERFIILRHFSRKLQLAAIALCAITAAALSLITLEPAQSKPQEKPATSSDAPSDNEKSTEPDHVTIDDRFILCPVTTELQRSLLGDVDAPKTDASLCVFANFGAYREDAIEADSAFFAGLSEQLSKLAKRDNRCAIVNVQVGQVSQPFDQQQSRAEQLSKVIEKLSRDAGFKQSRRGVTYQATTSSWSEIAAGAEAAAKLAGSDVEDSIGNEQVRVFPVRTFLSRMLMQDADCIVNIRPVWQKDDGPNFVDGFVPSLKEFIPRLKFVSKKLMYVRVRFAPDARAFVDQWSGNLERSKKFGQELGFADSRNQQAGVSDEDAKQDKEARTAGAVAPAGAAADKASPALAPPKLTPNTIAGRVVDDKDAPISGAEVFLFWVKQSDLSREQIAQTKTDDQGNYRFDIATDIAKEFPNGKLPPLHDVGDKYIQRIIRAPGRISEWSLEVPQMVAQQGRWHPSKMTPAATLEGYVTGPDGKAVSGATVAVNSGSLGLWEGANSARTDADGYYKITDAPPFDLEQYKQQLAEQEKRAVALAAEGRQAWDLFVTKRYVIVTHADFARLYSEIEHLPGTKDLRLKSSAVLEGRVVFPDGKPAAGAVVRAFTSYEVGADGKATIAPQQFYTTTVVADGAGRYRITLLPADKYNLWADLPDWVNVGATAVATAVDKSTTAPDLAMTKGGMVRVRLVDATTKQPIAVTPNTRAMVIVAPAPLDAGGRISQQNYVNASADGRFERRALPGEKLVAVGAVDVDGELKWYCNERLPVTLTEGQTTDLDMPVTKIVPQPTLRTAEIRPAQPTADPLPDVQRDPEAVLKAANEALEKNPDDLAALLQHADALYELGRDRLALEDYQQLLKLDLEPPVALAVNNNLALLLAASPDERLRDGKRAVELAKKAVGLQDPPPHQALDTLAAAYAEAGDFDQAVKTEEQAIAAAPQSYREEYEGYVKQYKSHEPRREAKDTSDDAATPKEKDGATSPSTPQLRKRVALTKVGESLLSTTDDKAAATTAQFLVEPRSAGQKTQQQSTKEKPPLRAGAQTVDKAKNDDSANITPIKAAGENRASAVDVSKVVPAMELVQIPVRVMNESGKPIVGATIEPLGIRLQNNDPKIELVQITDANGKAAIPFPKRFIDEYGIPQFQVQVRHPEYIAISSQIRTDGKETTLKLARGGAVEIKPSFAGGIKAGDVYGIAAQLDPTLRWVNDRESGSIRSPQLPPGNVLISAVSFPSSSGPLFSDAVTTKVVNGETQLLELDLKTGWKVSGRLADNVPRPVQNGRVMLQMISKKNEHMGWSDWTTVRADGSFTFTSLPRVAGAEIRITAVCNGFISKTPDELAKQYQLLAPQTFVMKENGIECTLEMTPAAKCLVKVQDTQGKPLAGVQVGVQPAVLVENGTSSFGDLNGMREMLEGGMYRPVVDRAAFPYVATSDDNGNAELSNLPPFPTYISAASEHYSLPKNPIFALAGAPPIPIIGIFLNSGETTTPTLTLIANKPSDTKTR